MSKRLVRASLWTDFRWASGTMVAVLPLVACTTTEEITNHLVSRRGTLAVPQGWEELAEFTVGRVVRLEFDTTGTDYLELRLREILDGVGRGGVVTATATGIEYDLGIGAKLVQQTVDGRVALDFSAQYLPAFTHVANFIQPALPAHITNDVASPDTVVDIAYNLDTPLSAALKVAAASAEADGNSYEVYVRESASDYLLEVGEFNVGADMPVLRTRQGVRGITRRTSMVDQTTRAYPVGSDGGGVEDAWFRVEAVSVNAYIDIYDINGILGTLVLEDDQFNGLYWIHEDGVAHEITDTGVGAMRLSMASTTGIAVGEWGRIALDSTGARPTFIDYPSKQTDHGILTRVVRVPSVSATNWAKNHTLEAWAGASPGKPDDWNTGNATKITTAGLWRVGGQSARISDSGGTGEVAYTRTIYVPANWTVTYVADYRVTQSANQFQLTVTNPNGGLHNTLFNGVTANEWNEYRHSIKNVGATAAISLTMFFACASSGAPASFLYVDRIAIVVSPDAYTGPIPAGSGGGTIWRRASSHLQAHGDPAVTYEVDVLDLHRVDPLGAGEFDALELGQVVRLVGEGDGVAIDTTERVVWIERDHLVPHKTSLKLRGAQPGFIQMTGS